MKAYEILLVDDDPFILKGVGKDLEAEGYRVTTADCGERAIEWLNKTRFDLVITDLVMGSVNGIDVVKKAKELHPESVAMILTGFGDMTSAIEALRSDADDYLLKPCEPEEMHFRVSNCLERLELRRKVKIYEDMLPICCLCKKIRIDSNSESGNSEWVQMEKYITDKAGVHVVSTYCPKCAKEFSQFGMDIDSDPVDLKDLPE